jgi:hypothetical protein
MTTRRTTYSASHGRSSTIAVDRGLGGLVGDDGGESNGSEDLEQRSRGVSSRHSLPIGGIITRVADAAAEPSPKSAPCRWSAAYIGMCEVSIARYVKAGIAPRKCDVDAWIAAGGDLLFATHRDRALYLGRSVRDAC